MRGALVGRLDAGLGLSSGSVGLSIHAAGPSRQFFGQRWVSMLPGAHLSVLGLELVFFGLGFYSQNPSNHLHGKAPGWGSPKSGQLPDERNTAIWGPCRPRRRGNLRTVRPHAGLSARNEVNWRRTPCRIFKGPVSGTRERYTFDGEKFKRTIAGLMARPHLWPDCTDISGPVRQKTTISKCDYLLRHVKNLFPLIGAVQKFTAHSHAGNLIFFASEKKRAGKTRVIRYIQGGWF